MLQDEVMVMERDARPVSYQPRAPWGRTPRVPDYLRMTSRLQGFRLKDPSLEVMATAQVAGFAMIGSPIFSVLRAPQSGSFCRGATLYATQNGWKIEQQH